MNKVILKHLSLYSLLAGLIFGVFAAIPYIGGYALFAVLFLSAPVVMLFLIMAGKYDLTTGKDSIINGAISGFSQILPLLLLTALLLHCCMLFLNLQPTIF